MFVWIICSLPLTYLLGWYNRTYMSEKNSSGKYSHTPSANELNVFDPNVDLPSEPPPSYDEAMADPSVSEDDMGPQTPLRPPQTPSRRSSQSGEQYSKYSRPVAPPPNMSGNSNRLTVPGMTSTSSSTASSLSSSNHSYTHQQPQRPSAPPPQHKTSQLPKPSPINPNPYLPWRYPSSYRCSKCENTGYKKKNGHACKTCWGRFRPQTTPPATKAELERLVKHRPAPNPINTNVVKLPPGATVMPTGPRVQAPTVVKPGDPRIGGILCPKCNGRGMVHFFLDLERCSKCNGLGRVGSNGRPL